MNPNSSKWVLVCAFGLLAAFFMPWFQLMGAGMSGYGLGKLGSYGNYVWIVPVLAGATILVTFMRNNNRWLGALSGIVPLGFLAFLLARLGAENGSDATRGAVQVAGQVFSIGAWLTVLFSIGIVVSALVQMPSTMKRGWLVALVVLSAVLITGGGCAGGTRAQLVKRREAVQRSWAALDLRLQRRNERIGGMLESIRPLVSDQPALSAVAEAQSRFADDTPARGIQAGRAMDAALAGLLAARENDPRLRGDGRVGQFLDELVGDENLLSAERSRYNAQARTFNRSLTQFPTMLFAGALGFSQSPVYEVDQAGAAPRVTFGSR